MKPLETNVTYIISWKGEADCIEAVFKKLHNGFYVFYKDKERIVCRPSAVNVKKFIGKKEA